jgi:biopolymer transport protein ExbD
MGLKVYVPKPGTYALATDKPWKEPLVLRIDALGNLYLNRVPVRFADLGERLEKALSLRADWTVFVDADPDVNAGEVIGAVDLIHGIGGTKVFLVTLSMKKEKPEFAILPPCESKAPHPPELRLPLKWRDVRFYEYPDVSFVVNESGEVSNVKIQRKGDYPEFAEWLARSARKLKYPPAPGCGKHELNVGYYW